MQQAHDQTCVIAGCNRARCIIDGHTMSFCKQHYLGNGNVKRRGLPAIRMSMIRLLIALKASQDAGNPYAEIPKGTVGKKTITCLLRRGYVRQHLVNKNAYMIIHHGLTILAIYTSPMFKRTDGICAECGTRPREMSGKRMAIYCRECINKRNKRARDRKAAMRPKIDTTVCADCQQAPRYATKNRLYSRCKACESQHNRTRNQTRYDDFVARLTAGEHVPCMKCENLRHSVPGIVYSYCLEHLREYQSVYKAKSRRAA